MINWLKTLGITLLILTSIFLIITMLTSCNSMLQNKGIVVYENNLTKEIKEEIENIQSNINIHNSLRKFNLLDRFHITTQNTKQKEVKNMEGINELLTVIGSAIAGVYCAVKAIVSFIKKLKGDK